MREARFGLRRLWVIGVVSALAACAAEDADPDDGPPMMMAPLGGSGGAAGGMPVTMTGGSGAAGRASSTAGAGAAGMAGGSGGMGPRAGMGSPAGSGAAGGAPMEGVDPSAIELQAIAANGTIGLDWSRVAGATGYRVYFANAAGVTPQSAQPIEVSEPVYVHRALTNGMPYYYVVTAVLASGEGPPSPEATATPGGEWVLEQLGSGDLDDVLTGKRVARVPVERRVQIFLLPEGYLASELAGFHDHASHMAGRMNDVDRWIDQVLAFDPYHRFKEAFVIWYLPRASAAHAGEGTTAFGAVVANGAVTSATAVAAPLWSALDDQGEDAFPFAAGTTQPANFVAAFMVLDPERGRAGFSGITTSLRNPTNQQQNIRAAFGLGHPHEFTHAFSRVADEYMETDNAGRQGQDSETDNVVASNQCDSLPWAHLLEGRGINTTPNLIGAFGSPELGYHSELHCQMNGTHDNGQFWCAPEDERYTTLTLRPDRFCNFCREITAYRVFERTGILAGNMGFETWKAMYRGPFYDRFGFVVPEGDIPQTLMCSRNGPAKPVYEACMP